MMTFIRKLLPKWFKRRVRETLIWVRCASQVRRLACIGAEKGPPRVFYLGVVEHINLGDLAQYLCIKQWIRTSYPERQLVEFSATAVVHPAFDFVRKLKKIFGPDDMIVFQSGYTTQDLGGYHELMHRIVIDHMPDAPILMMPQTIFFQHEENRRRTAESYNRASRMLFLARDRVSYEAACEMFPDVTVRLFPDIVTTRIGRYRFDNKRDRVLFCCRDDSEKYYPDEEIARLRGRVSELLPTDLVDTQSNVPLKTLLRNLEWYIDREIARFSFYRLTITDRYHGTIFSLAANTPVIIIKTTDHKVTTGAEWFKGVYDGYIHVADSLDHAFDLAREIVGHQQNRQLHTHFETEYYGKLKALFEQTIRR